MINAVRATEALRKEGASIADIYEHALRLGYTIDCALEATNEQHRRDVINDRAFKKATRKEMSDCGRKFSGKPYRRLLIAEKTPSLRAGGQPNAMREYHYHATKGARSYRIPSK